MTQASSNAAPEYPDHIDAAVLKIAGVVVLGAIMSILDITVVNVALPTFSTDLADGAKPLAYSTVAWTVTGYTLALATVIPLTGWAADRFGTKRLYLAAIGQEVPEPAASPARPAERAPAGRRLVTCVVSYLAQPAETGLDPESLRADVERFHAAGRAVFGGHGGSVVELRTDAVVAVLGMPVTHEDDAQRALRAAAELRDEVPFGVRSGACTGEVVAAGNPPVIGEAVAIAEQLAHAAASGEIRLSESTWQVVRHAARASPLSDGGLLLGALDADAPAIARHFDQPLIGREQELGVLRETFARVAARRTPGAADGAGRAGRRQVAPRRRAGRHGAHRPLPRLRRGHHAVAAARGDRAGAGRPDH